MDLIALSIPIFLLLLAIEIYMDRKKGTGHYRFHDAVTDISCGMGAQVIDPIAKVMGFVAYTYLYLNHKFITFENPAQSIWVWLLALLLVDFGYYWWHRTSHRNTLIWASHVIHHQSEDYNFAVALRQAWFSAFTTKPFYLPIALLGVPPAMFYTAWAIVTLYQFWIHTEFIGKLGPIEYVFNTASHHRVHHAVNPQYLDKNYGAILIIWDRMFGTFEEEKEKPVYGTVKPLKSWNPIWANFEHFGKIGEAFSNEKGLKNKLMVLLKPPGWTSLKGEYDTSKMDVSARKKFDEKGRFGKEYYSYITLQFFLVVAFLAVFLFQWQHMPLGLTLALGVWVFLATWNWGNAFEGKSLFRKMEWFKLFMALVIVVIASDIHHLAWWGAAPFFLISALWLLNIQQKV